MMGIDVTGVRPTLISKGSRAEILGNRISIDEVAGWAGTISYELLTRLGSRYARVYSSGES
jgi:alanine racemase